MQDGARRSGLAGTILKLGTIRDAENLRVDMLDITRQMGFEFALFAGRFSVDGSRSQHHVVSNYPAGWTHRYQSEDMTSIDPTVAHATRSQLPVLWRSGLYVTEAQRRFREEAMAAGLKTGVTFPVHTRNGDTGLLSLALSSDGKSAVAHVIRSTVWGALLATATHEATRAIFRSRALMAHPKLTHRETEVLRWLVAGKSNWDISVLLGISEHGVVHHVRNLLQKMDVLTRRQAVVKAIALGLV